MELKEILREVRRLELSTRRNVSSQFSGFYHSAFRGLGMQFADTRPYVPGDDVRHIAWNVTARSQTVQIKRFEEERELNVLIALDVSSSRNFGGEKATVKRRQILVGASLAMAALQNNDRAGCLLFSNDVEKTVPTKKGRAHILRILRDMLAYEPQQPTTSLDGLLTHLDRKIKKRSLIFILSDFIAPLPNERALKLCSRKHEIICLCIGDPFESVIPSKGLVRVVNNETGQSRVVDAALHQKTFAPLIQKHRQALQARLRRAGIDFIQLQNPEEDMLHLTLFLIERKGQQGFARVR